MSKSPNRLSRFWQELKRRRVFHVVVVYATTAFVILEAADIVFPRLGFADRAVTWVMILLAVGFPAVVIFSWIFDVTPGGIEKTKPAGDVPEDERKVTPNSWKIATYISLVVILGLLAYNLFIGNIRMRIDASLEKSVAVLPFLNLSGDPNQEFICDGLAEEIITNLFKIASFDRVPTLNSVLRYKNSDKSIPTISEELGVNYILEGSYKRVDDRMRFTVTLKESKSDKQIWYQDYDQNSEFLSAIPSKIALQIAEHINTYLSGSEIEILERIPTSNQEAYIKYIEGNYYFNRTRKAAPLYKAIEIYKEATALDPGFALAYTYMARCYVRIYWYQYDRSQSLLEECEKAIETAYRINPELPEVYIARANYYYQGFLDYANALEQLEIALGYIPGDAQLRHLFAIIYRRMGKWEQAIKEFEMAHRLDPESQVILVNMTGNYTLVSNYRKAEEYFTKLQKIDPNNIEHYSEINRFYLKRDGNTIKARELVENAVIVNRSMYESDEYAKYWAPVMLDVFDGNYQKALNHLSSVEWEGFINHLYYYPKNLLKAWIYLLLELQDEAEIYFDSSRIQLENSLLDLPDDPRIVSALGVAYAGSGNKTKAVEYGLKAVELYPLEKDAINGLFRVDDLAWIYILLKEYDKALKQIEILLSNPGFFSGPFLKLDPKYKPLWDHPDFLQLVEEYRDVKFY